MEKLVEEAQRLLEVNDSFGGQNMAHTTKPTTGEKKKKETAGSKKSKDKLGNQEREEMLPHQLANVDLQNPSTNVKTNEWYQWFCEIQMKLQKVEEENKKVEGDIHRRHDRYILRETEYRNTIDDLQRELRVRNGYEKDADLKN